MANETKCWLCESVSPEVRNPVLKSGPFAPDTIFEVSDTNTQQVPCNNDEYHGKAA